GQRNDLVQANVRVGELAMRDTRELLRGVEIAQRLAQLFGDALQLLVQVQSLTTCDRVRRLVLRLRVAGFDRSNQPARPREPFVPVHCLPFESPLKRSRKSSRSSAAAFAP